MRVKLGKIGEVTGNIYRVSIDDRNKEKLKFYKNLGYKPWNTIKSRIQDKDKTLKQAVTETPTKEKEALNYSHHTLSTDSPDTSKMALENMKNVIGRKDNHSAAT